MENPEEIVLTIGPVSEMIDLTIAIKTVMDVLMTTGVYPKSTAEWSETLKKEVNRKERTTWQEGWNAAQWEIFSKTNDALGKLEEGISYDLAVLMVADVGWMQNGKFILNMNDTFSYGADCEETEPKDYPELARLFKYYGCGGLDYWVAKKRGYDPVKPEYRKRVRMIRHEEKKRDKRKAECEAAKET